MKVIGVKELYRIYLGGGWYYNPMVAALAGNRYKRHVSDWDKNMGFRLILEAR